MTHSRAFVPRAFVNTGAVLALAAFVAAAPLGGCVVAAVGAAGTAGYVAAQDRSAGTVVDDATIRTKIAASLFDRSEKLYADVSSEVVQGRVLLTGNVPTPQDKVEASRIAWSVAGVKEVRNEIEVTDKGGIWNYTKDTWITTQVKTAILTDSDIRGINYTVETTNQVVYLTGVAANQAELDKAINHARNVSGVVRVVPYVVIQSNAPRAAAAPAPAPAPVEPNAPGETMPGTGAPTDLAPAPSKGRIETQTLP
jgi:osmotically-inducible protein OsmY